MNKFALITAVSLFLLTGVSCQSGSIFSDSNLDTSVGQPDSTPEVLPPPPTAETTTAAVKSTPVPAKTKPVAPTPQPVVTLKAAQLIGGWVVIKAQTSFASITFINDGTYVSHLNDRPFDSGKWELNGATLTLTSDAGYEMNKIFTKVSIEGNRLRANDGVIPMIWERAK